MPLMDLTDWLDARTSPEFIWYVKRLSGNDTLANGSHQAGPYITKDFLFQLFPSLHNSTLKNPDIFFTAYIDSHPNQCQIRAIWYNNKYHGTPNGRNETRLTGWGGISSPLLDPESTGALVIFAFHLQDPACHIWVCDHETEAELVEDRIGPVDPGQYRIWAFDRALPQQSHQSCWLSHDEIPPAWFSRFPSGEEIIRTAIARRPLSGLDSDKRLTERRRCEFELFRSVEEAIELPFIKRGFENLDEFIARSQTILQRRKARSGRSLELHVRQIFIEDGLIEGRDFDYQPESELGKHPDFLFPSQAAYQDSTFPQQNLRMLAVKTTCKDRWRQILNEADRVTPKHLLTLQEGVSQNQFDEMQKANIQLVVPAGIIKRYPESVQPYLQTLENFIGDVRFLSLD